MSAKGKPKTRTLYHLVNPSMGEIVYSFMTLEEIKSELSAMGDDSYSEYDIVSAKPVYKATKTNPFIVTKARKTK
jgi:hypothetical protein